MINAELTKAEKTRQYIIETAAPLFNKKGYAGTSISDLLELLNLSKGALYGNFKDKNEIAAEAFAYNFSRMKSGYENEVEGCSNHSEIDKLKALVNYPLVHFDIIFSKGGCPILNSAVEADDNALFIQLKVKKAIRLWKSMITAIIRAGIENNVIKADTNPESIATMLIAILEGGYMLAGINQSKKEIATVVKGAHIIIDSIKR